jgi:hypothetical protein
MALRGVLYVMVGPMLIALLNWDLRRYLEYQAASLLLQNNAAMSVFV